MKIEETAWEEGGKTRWGLCEQGGGDMIAEIDERDDAEQIAKQIAAQSLGLFEQIEASAQIEDLDDAVRPIQVILGQQDGGLAAQFFTGRLEFWENSSPKGRKFWLIRYCVFELGMLESGS